MGAELGFTDHVKEELNKHHKELEVVGTVAALALLAVGASKLRPLFATGSELLPELSLTESAGTKAYSLAEDVRALASRPQTLSEKVADLTIRKGFQSVKPLYNAVKKVELEGAISADEAVVPNDLRKHAFNGLLARLQGGDYVLHGSYALEDQLGVGARKALKDLDLLSTDATLAQGGRAASTDALLTDLQRRAQTNLGDGLSFSVANDAKFSDRVFPRMRHLVAHVQGEGVNSFSIPLDVRVGAKTILPTETRALTHTIDGVTHTTSVEMMQKEENLAYKLYTYSNRVVGGLLRKSKDLGDMASIIKSGVDESKVTQALQSWTSQGFEMAPLRHPAEFVSAKVFETTRLGLGQSLDQVTTNFNTVKNFYAGIAPEVEQVPLRSDVKSNVISSARRFVQKHYVLYPAELK